MIENGASGQSTTFGRQTGNTGNVAAELLFSIRELKRVIGEHFLHDQEKLDKVVPILTDLMCFTLHDIWQMQGVDRASVADAVLEEIRVYSVRR